jgi:hypothetical protein
MRSFWRALIDWRQPGGDRAYPRHGGAANGTQFMRDSAERLIAQGKPGEHTWQVQT